MHREIDSSEFSSLQQSLAETGFTRVPNFLVSDMASACTASIREFKDWTVAISDEHANAHYYSFAQDATASTVNDDVISVMKRAKCSFQFFFELIELTDGPSDCLPLPWKQLRAYILGPAFRRFCARLGKMDNVSAIDGIISRLSLQHFFGLHWDKEARAERMQRLAYVLCLTNGWGADWGGATLLWNTGLTEATAFRPVFNSLLVFRLPRPHSVEPLAAFVDQDRVMVSGFVYVPSNSNAAMDRRPSLSQRG